MLEQYQDSSILQRHMHSGHTSEWCESQTYQIIDQTNKQRYPICNLTSLSKQVPSLTPGECFIDDQFMLKIRKDDPNIKIKRLSQVFPLKANLFLDLKSGKELSNPTKSRVSEASPSYLSEINITPFHHFCNIIEPIYINQQGFYHVTVVKDGILAKLIVDDKFYYDERQGKIVSHSQISNYAWVHIVLKAWAKINGGYEMLEKCKPFSFIRTFSFPDWQVMNPAKEQKQALIAKLKKASSGLQILVTQTKDNARVGLFGFPPSCCSFVITGHYQEYGDIYLKIISFIHGGWNSLKTSKSTHHPEELPVLNTHQFLLPLQEYLNLFHLIYSTSNKYQAFRMNQSTKQLENNNRIKQICYDKYTLNVDAMEKNAVLFALDVRAQTQINSGISLQGSINNQARTQVGLSLFFPKIKRYDLTQKDNKLENDRENLVVPWCKIMIGLMLDSSNLEVSYAQSVKQKLIHSQLEERLKFARHINQHNYVLGDYFKGYASQLTYNLLLKPGRYLVRLKLQQKLLEYRCFVSATALNAGVKIFDPKPDKNQQLMLLHDCLFRKAVNQKKFVTFVNPSKRGSWISCRNDYTNVGYSYIAVHVVRNAVNKILIKIEPKQLKDSGYMVKGHKDIKPYEILVDCDQNAILIIKHCREWKGPGCRVWPPPGIQFIKVPNLTVQSNAANQQKTMIIEQHV